MGQEKDVKIATLPLQEVTSVDAANLVNTYADDLVSGLFEDVDKLLDGDEAAIANVEQEASLLIAPPPAGDSEAEPPAATEASSTALVPADKDAEAEVEALLSAENGATSQPVTAKKSRLGKWLDRFLLTTTIFSLLGILGFLVYGYQRGVRWVNPMATPDVETAQNQSDVEFLEYLDRSLEILAKKAEQGTVEAESTVAQLPNVSVLPASPPLLPPLTPAPAAGGLMSPRPGPINIIERVYIPYQTAQQPAAPDGTPQTPQGVTNAPQPQNVSPAAIHVLVGLLELGERSAALFEINGVSRRIYIGEPIGGSGWSLVSVSNNEARIRRNGEVRSIYIGQQF